MTSLGGMLVLFSALIILCVSGHVAGKDHFSGDWGECRTLNLSQWNPRSTGLSEETNFDDWNACGVLKDMGINQPIGQIQIIGTSGGSLFGAPSLKEDIGKSFDLVTILMHDL